MCKEGVLDLENTVITLSSITYAMKAKKLLSRAGIRSELIKVDSSKSKKGCAFGLEIPTSRFYDAVAELRRYNFDYAVYPKG